MPVGVIRISFFFMSIVIFVSSNLSPVRDTSIDFERYCRDGVAGTWSRLVSEVQSVLLVDADMIGEEDIEDLSPGLEPFF